jgi:hypothetical protein
MAQQGPNLHALFQLPKYLAFILCQSSLILKLLFVLMVLNASSSLGIALHELILHLFYFLMIVYNLEVGGLGDFVVDGCLVEVIGDVVGGVIEA